MNQEPSIAPLYEKVKTYVLSRINSGELAPSSRVPSENELVKILSVSRMTANRALKELSNDGVLTRIAGVGTFVAQNPSKGHLLEVRNIAEEIEDRGHAYSNRVIQHEKRFPESDVALQMGIVASTPIFKTVMVHYEENTPIQLEYRYVNLDLVPEYAEIDLATITPSRFLLDSAPLQKVKHTVKAAMPSTEEQRFLAMQSGVPCLVLERLTWSMDKKIAFATLHHPADRYTLSELFEV